MTENEAIELLEYFNEKRKEFAEQGLRTKPLYFDEENYKKFTQSLETAISALEEIQQYRSIGTVSECREAMEKQRAKKYKLIHPCKSVNYYQCPICGGLLHINENYCGGCGQAVSWEED